MMDTIEVERHALDAEGAQDQQQGGHRINRRLIGVVAGAAIIVAIAGVAGIKAAGNSNQIGTQLVAQPDDSTQSTRDRASTEDLRAEAVPHATPAPLVSSMLIAPRSQTVTQPPQTVARNPSRYQQWAADKYLRALEAPQMVAAFHGPTNALELGPGAAQTEEQSAGNAQGGGSSQGAGTTLHPPASPY